MRQLQFYQLLVPNSYLSKKYEIVLIEKDQIKLFVTFHLLLISIWTAKKALEILKFTENRSSKESGPSYGGFFCFLRQSFTKHFEINLQENPCRIFVESWRSDFVQFSSAVANFLFSEMRMRNENVCTQFRSFPIISSCAKILAAKLFDYSWGNSYIPFPSGNNLVPFHLWWVKLY